MTTSNNRDSIIIGSTFLTEFSFTVNNLYQELSQPKNLSNEDRKRYQGKIEMALALAQKAKSPDLTTRDIEILDNIEQTLAKCQTSFLKTVLSQSTPEQIEDIQLLNHKETEFKNSKQKVARLKRSLMNKQCQLETLKDLHSMHKKAIVQLEKQQTPKASVEVLFSTLDEIILRMKDMTSLTNNVSQLEIKIQELEADLQIAKRNLAFVTTRFIHEYKAVNDLAVRELFRKTAEEIDPNLKTVVHSIPQIAPTEQKVPENNKKEAVLA